MMPLWTSSGQPWLPPFARRLRLANPMAHVTVAGMRDARFSDLKRRACGSPLLRSLIWLVVTCLATGATSRAAETEAKSSRLTVAVLTFADQSGDPEAAHWRYTIE